jgi:hypothetical protein
MSPSSDPSASPGTATSTRTGTNNNNNNNHDDIVDHEDDGDVATNITWSRNQHQYEEQQQQQQQQHEHEHEHEQFHEKKQDVQEKEEEEEEHQGENTMNHNINNNDNNNNNNDSDQQQLQEQPKQQRRQNVDEWCISVKTVGGGFDDCFNHIEGTGTTNSTTNTNTTINTANHGGGERLFSVTVSPEDCLSSLHQEIEGATGVKVSQQRLIYRGRLIGKNDEPQPETNNTITTNSNSSNNNTSLDGRKPGSSKNDEEENNNTQTRRIKDIAGLCDGQTIHLVKKRENPSTNEDNSMTSTMRNSAANNHGGDGSTTATATAIRGGGGIDSDLFSTSGGITGGGALLAALLGLGSLADDSEARQQQQQTRLNDATALSNATTATATTGTGTGEGNATTAGITPSWRSSRSSHSRGSRSRRQHYRLSTEDLEMPDPGSLEPVRQGLMTLHTILPPRSSSLTTSHEQQQEQPSPASLSPSPSPLRTLPLEVNRVWFRGQWLDCRDTVNQWLEAIVVEVLHPHDILPFVYPTASRRVQASGMRGGGSSSSSRPQRSNVDNNDPAVSANDLEGRRRLLLEPCALGHIDELRGELAGYRLRPNNDGVQLLLVSYPGWPRRWDEWIRSDSERLRPFRTRTRHPNSVRCQVCVMEYFVSRHNDGY